MSIAGPQHETCAGATARDCKHGRAANGCEDCKVRLFSVCAALEATELDELDRISQAKLVPARTTLFEQGALAGSVFNVTDGVVRLYKSLPDGRRQIVGFALPGDFLGLALQDRYGVTAEAVTAVSVCRFARSAFLGYIDGKPHLLRRLHEFAGHELSLAQDQMLLLDRRTAEEGSRVLAQHAGASCAHRGGVGHRGAADEPAGHRRLSRSHHRDGEPHADAACA